MASIIPDPCSLHKDQWLQFYDPDFPKDFVGPFKVSAVWNGEDFMSKPVETQEPFIDCDRLYTLTTASGEHYIYKANRKSTDTIQRNSYSKTRPYELSRSYIIKVISQSGFVSGNRS